MTRNWRHESLPLFSLWAAVSALLVVVARVPPRPAVASALPSAAPATAAAPRRPATARPAPRSAAQATRPKRADTDSEPASEVEVETLEMDSISITGEGRDFDDEDGYSSDEYGFSDWYSSHFGYRRWGHVPGRPDLRRSSSSLFSSAASSPGAVGDPCGVFPGACAPTTGAVGGSYNPPPVAATARSTGLIPREQPVGATATRDGDTWRLGNGSFTLAVDAFCLLTARRAGDERTFVAAFVAPPSARCTVRSTLVPWDDRNGAAIELTWASSAGSMRAVVSLADDGDAPEASVSRTDARGTTLLTNLGATALSWTVAGRSVTLAPGDAVRVVVRPSVRA